MSIHRRSRPALLSLIRAFRGLFLLLPLWASFVAATTITFVNKDGFGEGLNDQTTVAPVPGNPATRRGEQLLNVFQAAGNYWEERLDSSVEIRVEASLDPLFCASSFGTLGGAGPLNGFVNTPGVPLADTAYSVAQANSYAGFDVEPGVNDVVSTFNSILINGSAGCLGGKTWWLGINAAAPSGTTSLYDTIIHEIGHGIGFLSFVDESGEKVGADPTTNFEGYNDAFMLNLKDQTTGKLWKDMSNSERALSSVNTGNLVWNGNGVTAQTQQITSGKNGGRLRMYAPNPYNGGSSVSHWDTAVSPNELMEPFATSTSNDCATLLALKDMGWSTKSNAGDISFSRSSYTGAETSGSVSVQVTRSGNCGPVSVTVNSANGSAFAPSDYASVNTTLSWADGESGSKPIEISLVDDGIEELGGETFNLALSNGTGGVSLVAPTTAVVTILDEFSDDLCVPIKGSNGKIAVICL